MTTRLPPALICALALLLPLVWPAPAALAVVVSRMGLPAAVAAAARHGWRPVRALRLAGLPCLLLARAPGADRPPGMVMLPAPLGAICGTRAPPG